MGGRTCREQRLSFNKRLENDTLRFSVLGIWSYMYLNTFIKLCFFLHVRCVYLSAQTANLGLCLHIHSQCLNRVKELAGYTLFLLMTNFVIHLAISLLHIAYSSLINRSQLAKSAARLWRGASQDTVLPSHACFVVTLIILFPLRNLKCIQLAFLLRTFSSISKSHRNIGKSQMYLPPHPHCATSEMVIPDAQVNTFCVFCNYSVFPYP